MTSLERLQLLIDERDKLKSQLAEADRRVRRARERLARTCKHPRQETDIVANFGCPIEETICLDCHQRLVS